MSDWTFEAFDSKKSDFKDFFTVGAAEQQITATKASVLSSISRVLRLIANLPGAYLVRVGVLFSSVVVLLSVIGVWQLSSGWWRFSLTLSLLSLGFTLGFAWRRADLLQRLASKPVEILDIPRAENSLVTSGNSSEQTQAAFIDLAQREGEAFAAARAEFKTRTTWFFPQIEAGQRALRQLAGGAYAGSWLEHDLRPTLVFLVGAVVSVPVMIFSLLTSFLVMLFGG